MRDYEITKEHLKTMFNRLIYFHFKEANPQQFVDDVAAFLVHYMPVSLLGLYEFNTNMIVKIAAYHGKNNIFTTPNKIIIREDLLNNLYLESNFGAYFKTQIRYGDKGDSSSELFSMLYGRKEGQSLIVPLAYENNFDIIRYIIIYSTSYNSYTAEHVEICETLRPALEAALSHVLHRHHVNYTGATRSVTEQMDTLDDACPRFLTLAEHTAAYIKKVLTYTEGRISGTQGAADLLGLPPSTLWAKINKLHITIPRKKRG